ncbi:SPFH domain / Band 7 family protein [Actinomadura rubteroloni]|uniref:SPFH domain / Band 7 family protein n=1 Tax=Actinomadura rubteroloni TaxID=1926885 RepID=A0A2P4UQC7_9ACTN|nr:SPFH domain-containing protein [Actinomadura rubteroloni]POM27245.1 SPFH domain / Band 7 family protein [Actinomadura rubteroloni]
MPAPKRPTVPSWRSPRRRTSVVLAVLLAVVGIPVLTALFGGYERTGGGEVAVVRNGGFFDNNRIRQVIDPGSGRTWIGLYSKVHKYPAQQRFYTITSQASKGDESGVDVVTVPSSDGVNMGIEGTLYFTLNLDHATLRSFDDKYGTRKFRGADGDMHYAWNGDTGWSAWLDQIIRPVIDNALRSQVNSFRCAELVSSCALVQNASATVPVKGAPAQSNNANINKVQTAINTSLAADLNSTLGGTFVTNIHFNLVRVELPARVQDAVDRAQAAFAQVSEAQAKVASARAEAAANKARQDGYNKCPTCARIEELKALPQGITVYAPGNPNGSLFGR